MDSPLILVAGAVGVFLLVGAAVLLSLRPRRRRVKAVKPDPWSPDPALADGHRPPDAGTLSSQLLGLTRQVLGASGVALLVPGPNGWRVSIVSPGLLVSLSKAVPLKEGLLGLAYDGEKEIAADPVQPAALGYLPGEEEPLSVALVPVVHRGKTRGLVACHRPSGRSFDKEEMSVLRRCAGLLEGWEAYAAEMGDLTLRMDRSERLFNGLSAMLKEKNSGQLCHMMLDQLFDFVPAVMGFVLIQHLKWNQRFFITKPQNLDLKFAHLSPNTWTYRVLAKGEKFAYLFGDQSLNTAMPVLSEGEPFPAGGTIYLCPLFTEGDVFGVVGLVGRADVEFSESQRALVDRFVGQGSALVELSLMKEFEEENAIHDGLTGLYNRRYFDERLVVEMKRSQREGLPMSLLLLDVDRFKRVNDNHGHPVGDLVLQSVARSVGAMLRTIDVVCRYGGEEFAIILPSCTQSDAVNAAERIRQGVEGIPAGPGALPVQVTISVGVACFPQPFSSETGLLRAADEALYAAKTRGRNRVEIAAR
jgi:diguanylate cyclase (GGDEF)-like protein